MIHSLNSNRRVATRKTDIERRGWGCRGPEDDLFDRNQRRSEASSSTWVSVTGFHSQDHAFIEKVTKMRHFFMHEKKIFHPYTIISASGYVISGQCKLFN